MEKKLVRIALRSLKVLYNGDEILSGEPREPDKEDSKKWDNVVTASLLYPRPGVEAVNSTKSIDLPSGFEYQFNVADFWESGLFKEEILGESRLTITILDKDKIGLLTKFFRAVLTRIFGSWIDPLVKGITNIALGSVSKEVQTQIGNAIQGDKKNKVTPIATTGKVDFWVNGGQLFYKHLKSAPGWKPVPGDGQVEIPLHSPAKLQAKADLGKGPVEKGGTGLTGKKNKQLKAQTIIDKGAPNGVLALKIEVS